MSEEEKPQARRKGEIAVDVSGLDREPQINVAKALAEEDKKEVKPKLINLNYPPPGMSQEEIAGFWGELTPEQLKESEEADRRAKERIRTEHHTRYSYGY